MKASGRIRVDSTASGVMLTSHDPDIACVLPRTDAEGLYLHLGESMAVYQRREEETLPVQDVEPETDNLKLGNETYVIHSLLESRQWWTIQFTDDEGEQCELSVPEDFMVTVWRVIE